MSFSDECHVVSLPLREPAAQSVILPLFSCLREGHRPPSITGTFCYWDLRRIPETLATAEWAFITPPTEISSVLTGISSGPTVISSESSVRFPQSRFCWAIRAFMAASLNWYSFDLRLWELPQPFFHVSTPASFQCLRARVMVCLLV